MANGIIQIPEIRGGTFNCNFNDLMSYGNGIFTLEPPPEDPNKPTDSTHFFILQFQTWYNGAWYLVQFAVTIESTSICYMRKYCGSLEWTEWKSLTFN